MEHKSKVYILPDTQGRILRLDGGYTTPTDLTGWIEIDEGQGDKYNLCQSNYLPSPLYTDDGIPCWKWTGTECVLRSADEIEADRKLIPPAPPSIEKRVDTLESTSDDIILMMAEIIGG